MTEFPPFRTAGLGYPEKSTYDALRAVYDRLGDLIEAVERSEVSRAELIDELKNNTFSVVR